jgi:hypothetical protein
MPYISATDDRREKLRHGEPALSAGELNYQIFYHIKHYNELLKTHELEPVIEKFVQQFLGEKPNYQRYNDMTGALIRCGKEIIRRLKVDSLFLIDIMESYDDEIARYEDLKQEQNGDVE